MTRSVSKHFTEDELAYIRRHIKSNLGFDTIQEFCEKHNLNYTNTSRIFNGKNCELGTAIHLLKCAGILEKNARLKLPSHDLETVVKINDASHFKHEFFNVHIAAVRSVLYEKYPGLKAFEGIELITGSEAVTPGEQLEQEYLKTKVATRASVITLLNYKWFFRSTGEPVDLNLLIDKEGIYKSRTKLILDVKKDKLSLTQLCKIQELFTGKNNDLFTKD